MKSVAEALEVLGLKPQATRKDIEQAYRKLVKKYHPDGWMHDERLRKRAEEKLKALNKAFELLEGYVPPPRDVKVDDAPAGNQKEAQATVGAKSSSRRRDVAKKGDDGSDVNMSFKEWRAKEVARRRDVAMKSEGERQIAGAVNWWQKVLSWFGWKKLLVGAKILAVWFALFTVVGPFCTTAIQEIPFNPLQGRTYWFWLNSVQTSCACVGVLVLVFVACLGVAVAVGGVGGIVAGMLGYGREAGSVTPDVLKKNRMSKRTSLQTHSEARPPAKQ